MLTYKDLLKYTGGNRTPIYKIMNGYEHNAIFEVHGIGKFYKTVTGIMIDIAFDMISRGDY